MSVDESGVVCSHVVFRRDVISPCRQVRMFPSTEARSGQVCSLASTEAAATQLQTATTEVKKQSKKGVWGGVLGL